MKAQWTAEHGRLRCRWLPADVELGRINAELRAELEREAADAHQGKRPDQVQFSATVFFVAFALAFAVVVGVWLWRVF